MRVRSLIFTIFLFITANLSLQNAICGNTGLADVVSAPFDPAIAAQQYTDQLSDEQKERSDAYYEGGYWLLLILWVIEIKIFICPYCRNKNVNFAGINAPR